MNKKYTLKKTKKCKIYKSCDRVPPNESMNKCRPRYVSPDYNSKSNASANNWGECNMKNWYNALSKKHKTYKKFCKNERNCKLVKSKRTNSVDALELHNKMPYIWRFLKPKTRKHMIELAKKPVKDINIPFSLFSDKTIRSLKNETKRIKKLKNKYKNI